MPICNETLTTVKDGNCTREVGNPESRGGRPPIFSSWLSGLLVFAFHTFLSNSASCSGRPPAEPRLDPPATAPLVEEVDREFQARAFYYTGGRYVHQWFPYRLYVPPRLDASEKYPLLLWFHGAGESGTDNLKNMMHVDRAVHGYLSKHGPIPAFILVPQSPSVERGWFDRRDSEDDMLTVTWAMLEQTIKDNPIDEDRVVSSGVSSGGSACWEIALRHPSRFAAIAPLAAGGGDESQAIRLMNVPIWAFHNVYDLTTPIDGDRRMVAAVQRAGGRAHLTENPQGGHQAWAPAFENCGLLEWLLNRRRGESMLWFDLHFANWWVLGIQCGLPLLIATACFFELCRRKLTNVPNAPTYRDAKLPDLAQLIGSEG